MSGVAGNVGVADTEPRGPNGRPAWQEAVRAGQITFWDL